MLRVLLQIMQKLVDNCIGCRFVRVCSCNFSRKYEIPCICFCSYTLLLCAGQYNKRWQVIVYSVGIFAGVFLYDGKITVKKTGCSVECLRTQRRKAEYLGSSIRKVSNSKSTVNSMSAVKVQDPDLHSMIEDLHINHSNWRINY